MIRKFIGIELTRVFLILKTGGIWKGFIQVIMRTFIILFCTTAFGLTTDHLNSQNEKIIIDSDKMVSIDEVFKIIKQQTDYSFVYHEKQFENLPKVHLKKGTIGLKKLLAHSLAKSNVNVVFTTNNTIIIQEKSFNNKAQELIVSGIVSDKNGVPLAGASVLIKGTNKGAVTDFDGNYRIRVSSPANVLVFSSMSFKTLEVTVGSQTTINVSLEEDISTLEEVTINAGYYNTTQKRTTGSIVRVTAKDIEKQPVDNPITALQGLMSGVNVTPDGGIPGGNVSIQIRGQNFIAIGDRPLRNINAPLYIIDGVPFDSGDLESRNVVGGIIPVGVSPLNAINPQSIESIEVLKDADATAIYGSRGANGVVLITTKKGQSGKTQINFNVSSTLSRIPRFAELLTTEQYLQIRQEAFANDGVNLNDVNDASVPDLKLWDQTRFTDWQKVLIGGTAYRQNAQLSFSGGNAQTRFLLSAGYVNQTTVFPGDFKYTKATTGLRINHLSKNGDFKLNASVNYNTDTNNLPSRDLSTQARTLPPNAPRLYNEAGLLNWENSTWRNPLAGLEANYEAVTRNLIMNTVLTYSLIPSMEIKTNIGYTSYRLESHSTNPTAAKDPDTPEGQDSRFSTIDVNEGQRHSWIVEPQINWGHDWQNFSLKLLVGTSFQADKEEQLSQRAENFSSDNLLLSLSAANKVSIFDDNDSEYKFHSIFGRINFNWKDTYIVNLTGRRDGSSRFGSGKQFGNFGAIGAAWVLSKEGFLSDNIILSFAKLRGSYGITGSDTSPDYAFLDTYALDGNNYNGTGLEPTRLFNPNLAWGETKKIELALELGFLKDRFFITTAWYRNRSSNQLILRPLPSTTGFGGIDDNFEALVENNGLEIDLRSTNINTDHFTWRTAFNISINRSKLEAFPGLENSTFADSYIIGKSLGIRQLYDFVGVNPETGIAQFTDYNNDGIIGVDDRRWVEDFESKYFGGLSNMFQYRNFQLNVLFQFKKQLGLSYLGNRKNPGGVLSNFPVAVLDRWQQVGDVSPIQRFSSTNDEIVQSEALYSFSNARVRDRSFIKLQNISLNYNLSKVLANKIDANVYLQGQNLFVISSFDGPDPQIPSLDRIPLLRQFTLGLNLRF